MLGIYSLRKTSILLSRENFGKWLVYIGHFYILWSVSIKLKWRECI